MIPTLTTSTTLSEISVDISPGSAGYATFTAVVSPQAPLSEAGVPDGNVTFSFDGQAQTPVPLSLVNGQAVATIIEPNLTVGAHNVVASYSGTQAPYTMFAASDATGFEYTVPLVATKTVVQAPDTADVGQPVMFTAYPTHVPQVSNSLPQYASGSITFTIDGHVQPTVPLDSNYYGSNAAILTLTTLAAGDHVITAAYSGDSSFAASTSSPVDITINGPVLAGTTTTLTGPPVISSFGEPLTFTAIVSPQDSSALDPGLAGGTVVFTVDGQAQLPSSLSVNQALGVFEATFTSSTLAVGDHIVTAAYSGDSAFRRQLVGPGRRDHRRGGHGDSAHGVGHRGQSGPGRHLHGDCERGRHKRRRQRAGSGDGHLHDRRRGACDCATPVCRRPGPGETGDFYSHGRKPFGGGGVLRRAAICVECFAGGSGDDQRTDSDQPDFDFDDFDRLDEPGSVGALPVILTAVVSASGGAGPSGTVTFHVDGVAQPPSALSVVNGRDVATLTLKSLATGSHVVTASYEENGTFAASSSAPVQFLVNAPAVSIDGPLVASLERSAFTRSRPCSCSRSTNSLTQRPRSSRPTTRSGGFRRTESWAARSGRIGSRTARAPTRSPSTRLSG